MNKKLVLLITLVGIAFSCTSQSKKITDSKVTQKPNVIIVITDDQGYGDIGAHGNTLVKTPALNKFHDESVRLTDFHVGPTCAPSRSGLMTGRYADRVGVWHTIGGVSILRKDEVTMADVFNENGYETAMFGKWHLGDTYPSRPQDKGFKYTISHGGGGVGQTPDYWDNDYFDDTYFKNGVPTKYEGYCTDVWFDEAIKYIEEKKDQPFFAYISTNAPHLPYNVPEEYYNKYKDLDIPEFQKVFYGMITNVDDNFAKLQKKLEDLNIADNTIVIFMTDNGTASGYKTVGGKLYGFNGGMKGTKNSEYEGGHRVPFFISYPGKNINGGKDVTDLTAHLDILPTLATLCDLDFPERQKKIDGSDISSLLLGTEKTIGREYLITDSQRVQSPIKWRKSAVMSDKMRLVNGTELYDIAKDPGQENDIAKLFPEKVEKMRGFYNEWWSSVSTEFNQFPEIILGSDNQNPIELTCHDTHIHESHLPWNQNYIRDGKKNPKGGFFTVNFEHSGSYKIEISRWPFEAGLAINDAVAGREGTLSTEAINEGNAMTFKSGVVKIGAWEQKSPIAKGAKSLAFTGNFTKGKTDMSAWFVTDKNVDWGAYYIKVTRISKKFTLLE
ncbi:arylsulfatase [Polaribacter sp. HaHaR_3_91]|uniref:arylsulfatase n=1 Tax=Polaribacter sp. HaHaR_3_91 TaxID=2745561 RepID=UPI001C4F4820|nr:arylsulfatase [Polaribacter sp. HaHaR_3_91]QXP63052.1 arylsulfatase [Polaribacter sp. HaHaR_3_91]